ncbi:hypothetical protein [Candidatus Uabimicrobium sp. HlEnr_7]|uniref:hypothetical protein n=1 Tax=Candidatus Uabimicrobium helgolandensis TaxID=3095367 RepID=UPI003555D364
MTSYVPRYTKPKLQLQKWEKKLKRSIEKNENIDKIKLLALRVRESRVRLVKPFPYRITEEMKSISQTPITNIIEEFSKDIRDKHISECIKELKALIKRGEKIKEIISLSEKITEYMVNSETKITIGKLNQYSTYHTVMTIIRELTTYKDSLIIEKICNEVNTSSSKNIETVSLGIEFNK